MLIDENCRAFHIRLIHPEEKILFWKEIDLMTFTMVADDFMHENMGPMAYTLLPDRMEMVALTPKTIKRDEMDSSLQSIVINYDTFFGGMSKNRETLLETRWEVRPLDTEEEIEIMVEKVQQLPMEHRLVKKGESWRHSFVAYHCPECESYDEPSAIRDIIENMIESMDMVRRDDVPPSHSNPEDSSLMN